MKINELMVGDWVSYCGFYNKVIYIGQKVSMYDGKGTEFTTDPEHIRPIPLTDEILVKNGFEKNDRGDFVIDDTIVIAKENFCPKNYYACTWYQGDFDDEIYYIGICELTFVHQLQHLLRLAGIEKEIEL